MSFAKLLLWGSTVAGVVVALGSRSKASAGSPTVPPSDEGAKLQAGDLVVLAGDSHAVGLQGFGQFGPALKARVPGVQEVGAGVTGSGAPYWAPHLAAILERKPRVVLLSLGGNDFGRTDPANVQAAITAIVVAAHKSGTKLVWLEPTNMPFADPHNVRGMWQASGVTTYPTLELEPLPRQADQIHLTPAGYQTWANALARWLTS